MLALLARVRVYGRFSWYCLSLYCIYLIASDSECDTFAARHFGYKASRGTSVHLAQRALHKEVGESDSTRKMILTLGFEYISLYKFITALDRQS